MPGALVVWLFSVPCSHGCFVCLLACFIGCLTVLASLCVWAPPPPLPSLQDYQAANCSRVPALDVHTVSGCSAHAIGSPVHVPPRVFEAALVNAVQHSGYRLRFRNMRPHRDNSTETGWARR